MARTVKVTYSLPTEITEFIEALPRSRAQPRSAVVAEMLEEKRRELFQQELAKAYLDGAESASEFACGAFPIAAESLASVREPTDRWRLVADEGVRRGDIWWINWDPARGSEQSGTRPALIVQNDVGNHYSPTTIVLAITRTGRRSPVVVPIAASTSGLPQDSFVHAGQVLTVDKARLIERIGAAPPGVITEVSRAIRVSLEV